MEERVKVVAFLSKLGKLMTVTQRKYRSHFGVTDRPAANTIQAIVRRFQERESVKDRERNGRQIFEMNGARCELCAVCEKTRAAEFEDFKN